MANLPETPVWETGIYQLEETDPVQGGPNGIDNQQGKQLANRTAWLKSQVETLGTGKQPLDATLTAIAALNGVADRIAYFTGPDTVALTPLTAFVRTLLDDGDASAARSTLGAISQTQLDAAISALVNSSPATLDTLNELAAALGNDANFATTVTNALAAKAPIASPVFTGDPKAPTPAQFDNDTSLATTEFVRRALGNARGLNSSNVSTTLTLGDVGKVFTFYGSTASQILTFPAAASVPDGAGFWIINQGSVPVQVKGNGAELINLNTLDGALQSNALTLGSGDSIFFSSNGSNTWNAFGIASGNQFPKSLAANGYQKLPSGLIVQWGVVTITAASSAQSFSLPIIFPNNFFGATAGHWWGASPPGAAVPISAGRSGLGTIILYESAVPSAQVFYLAFGN